MLFNVVNENGLADNNSAPFRRKTAQDCCSAVHRLASLCKTLRLDGSQGDFEGLPVLVLCLLNCPESTGCEGTTSELSRSH